MLDVAGRALDSEETIERHNKYARELKLKSKELMNLIIVTSRIPIAKSNLLHDLDFELLPIKASRTNLFGFARQTLKVVKNKEIAGFVCGDPWESFWIALALKKIEFKSAKIQVQLHGDFGSKLWSKNSFILKVRQSLINLKSNSIDSLRFTSMMQQKSIQRRFKISCKNQIVIPVPLNIPSEIVSETKKEHLLVGFVGRIHLERGLDTFIKFSEVINLHFPNAQFNIIGEGIDSEWFETELTRRVPKDKLNFSTNLYGEDYFGAVRELRVLCSFAPSESYGRVAREALALGVPVIAVHSAGMDELAQSLSPGAIHFLPENLDRDEVINVFEETLRTKVPKNLIRQFNDSNQRVIGDLIQSWIEMVESE